MLIQYQRKINLENKAEQAQTLANKTLKALQAGTEQEHYALNTQQEDVLATRSQESLDRAKQGMPAPKPAGISKDWSNKLFNQDGMLRDEFLSNVLGDANVLPLNISKALLESSARSFGYHSGVNKKVRVNTISQSPTVTTAGSGVSGFNAFLDYAEKMSPLGNASAEACANYCLTLFSDYTRMVTMQNLFHDGGFSFTGVSDAIIADIQKANS